VFEGKHPAIIDRELFEGVQRALARRRRFEPPAKPFGRVPYPLSGARCAFCGEGLTGCSQKIEGRYRYEYYRCSTAQRRGRHACGQPMIRTPVFETQIAAYIVGMRLPPEYLRRVGELWTASTRQLQREFVREVFQEIEVRGREIVTITPRPTYAPLFVLDRRERFGELGVDSCNVAPRAGVRGTLLRNPRTGEPLSVPALVLPEAYHRPPKATLPPGALSLGLCGRTPPGEHEKHQGPEKGRGDPDRRGDSEDPLELRREGAAWRQDARHRHADARHRAPIQRGDHAQGVRSRYRQRIPEGPRQRQQGKDGTVWVCFAEDCLALLQALQARTDRHTFATKYLMAGGDIFSLQQILGHTSLEMVRRYVTLASQHVVVQHRKFSPMDRVVASFRRRIA